MIAIKMKRAALLSVLLGGIATAIWIVRSPAVRSSGSPNPKESAGVVGASVSNALPSFATQEQARAYYGGVTDGERKAVDLLDDALAQARARGNADPSYVATLEAMHADHRKRLDEHARAAGVRSAP